jgi:hypothetical protein
MWVGKRGVRRMGGGWRGETGGGGRGGDNPPGVQFQGQWREREEYMKKNEPCELHMKNYVR